MRSKTLLREFGGIGIISSITGLGSGDFKSFFELRKNDNIFRTNLWYNIENGKNDFNQNLENLKTFEK